MTNIKEKVLEESFGKLESKEFRYGDGERGTKHGINISDVKNIMKKAIDLTLAEVGEVIDEISFPIDKVPVQIKGSKVIIIEELKQKLGIK